MYRENGNPLATVSATRLKEGQKARADYSGYDVAESYPSQTDARIVTILEHRTYANRQLAQWPAYLVVYCIFSTPKRLA